MQKQYHIAVIGGGASGLLAAIAAKIEGGADCSVVILERNDRIGRKILSTGNGRCNLGNTVIQKENYSGSLLEKAFAIFQQAPKTEDYFRQMGL
ncbi:MAG: NAD(P)/FAD-dependent oxidoreductase, partial [Ruminococcus sp.]|nr:NAD(P)/FAD-dependent oxidoreductase [Ruminococcus sp.]